MQRREGRWVVRFSGFVLYSILSLLLQTGAARGQIVPIEESDFTDRALELPVGRLVPGSPAGEALNLYGVTFSGDASVPIAETVLISLVVPPEADSVIRNEPLEGTSREKAFTMQFRYPLKRIGFTLSNGTFATVATVRALTRKGELLGSLEFDEVRELRGPFVGLETSHSDGISTVILDYGPEANPEQMTRIRFDYLEPPIHRLWIPQVTAGQAGDLRLWTGIRLQTFFPTRFGTVSVVLRFFDTSGSPMPVDIDGEVNDTFEISMPFLGFRTLLVQNPGTGTLVGYAAVEAAEPFLVQSIYSVSSGSTSGVGSFGSSPILSEVGIVATAAQTLLVFPVVRQRGEGLNTGIAVVNTSGEENFVRLRILDDTGLRPDPIRNQPRFFLAPGEQRAFFLSELCSQSPPESSVCLTDFLADGDFRGSLQVASRQPVAVTVLVTRNGLPFSSLLTGSTQR